MIMEAEKGPSFSKKTFPTRSMLVWRNVALGRTSAETTQGTLGNSTCHVGQFYIKCPEATPPRILSSAKAPKLGEQDLKDQMKPKIGAIYHILL